MNVKTNDSAWTCYRHAVSTVEVYFNFSEELDIFPGTDLQYAPYLWKKTNRNERYHDLVIYSNALPICQKVMATKSKKRCLPGLFGLHCTVTRAYWIQEHATELWNTASRESGEPETNNIIYKEIPTIQSTRKTDSTLIGIQGWPQKIFPNNDNHDSRIYLIQDNWTDDKIPSL